jgi:transposase InsO family protein
MSNAATAMVTVGTRLVYDGWQTTVVGIEAGKLRLRDPHGSMLLVDAATLFADSTTRVFGVGEEPVEALKPLLDTLPEDAAAQMRDRLDHVRELLTGYRSGLAELAAPGEPRPTYHPSLPLMQRYEAKSTEIGVTVRTLQRWAAGWRERGPVGVLDGRHLRVADPLAGVDERWLAMCRLVLDEHVNASRPTRKLLLARVEARLAAEYGQGVVPVPGRRRAAAALAELTRGTNALVGSTKAKRSIAARPKGVYGRLRPTRPGEYVLFDSTPLDVFAMEPLALRWVGVELTIALDLYSRCVTGLRLTPVSTKSIDAAVVLYETLMPHTARSTGVGLLPYAGVPNLLVVAPTADDDPSASASGDSPVGGGLPAVAAEAVVVDHGRIFLSQHLLSVCQRLGISVQPARPLTPTDKATVERFFKTLREGLLAALPGYKGPDVYSRGKDPEGCTYFFIDELEAVIREWITTIYHHRAHAGLADAQVPGLDLSPAEMFAHGLTRAGRLRVPARADLLFDLLPVAWRTIQHYGVELNGLRYNGPGLTPYRNRTSPYTGRHAGKWPLRFDTDDISRVYFQDPGDQNWHTLLWEHADQVGMPFSADTLTYARRLAVADGRHVDDRLALAELLQRWDAGLVRHPAERRMAIRACQQRQARLAAVPATAADEVAGLPTVQAVTQPPQQPPPQPDGLEAGDDDTDAELDVFAGDEPQPVSDEEFYADALEVLP